MKKFMLLIFAFMLLLGGGVFGRSGTAKADSWTANPEYTDPNGTYHETVHIWQPAACTSSTPCPILVFYHGGAWLGGDWTAFQYQAEYFASRGVVTASVEYRRAVYPYPPVNATQDAIDAFNFLYDHASSYGFDANRMISVGGSAGGQLALATSVLNISGHTDVTKRPKALVLFNPVTNTTANYPNGYGLSKFTDKATGGTVDADLAAQYSPYGHLSDATPAPPTLIMQGTSDSTISYNNSIDFVNRMTADGDQATLIGYEGQDHGFFNWNDNRFNRYYYETLSQMDKFLSDLGYLTAKSSSESDPIVSNGSFENGTTDWTVSGSGTLTTTTTYAHSGSYSASFTQGGNVTNSLRQDITSDLTKYGQGEYLFRAWVKAAGSSPLPTRLTISITDSGGTHYFPINIATNPDYSVSTDANVSPNSFMELGGTRNLTWTGDLQSAYLYVRPDDPNNTHSGIYIDDVSLEFTPLIGNWKFNESTDTGITADSTDYQLDASKTGTTMITGGHEGNALHFNGSTDKVTLPQFMNPARNDFTVSLWVRTTHTPSASESILQQNDYSTLDSNGNSVTYLGRSWMLQEPTYCHLRSFLGNQTTDSTGIIPNNNTWNQLAITNKEGTLTLYLNGAAVSSPTPVTMEFNNSALIVGLGKGSNLGWNGDIDDVRLYDFAASSDYINGIYLGTK